jgi:hypothetical protein
MESAMINWFDLMRQAQGGAGLDNLARQFGLSQQQTNAAIAALMPAFAMGLQRAAANPSNMAQLFQVMSAGHFPAFWESAAQAFTPQARTEGSRLLDQLFGSDEISRRVAQQAAAFSGVGVDVLQQMLPLIAGIMAGGLTKMATGSGALFAQFGAAPQQAAAAGPQTGAGAWADLWGQWLQMGRPPAQPPQQQAPVNPFEEMMTAFLRAATPQQAPKPEPKPEPKAEPRAVPKPAPKAEEPSTAPPFDAWGQMVEKGHELQRQHLASLQAIFEGVWGRGPDRP